MMAFKIWSPPVQQVSRWAPRVGLIALGVAAVAWLGVTALAEPNHKFMSLESAGWADSVGEYVVVTQGGPGGVVAAGTSRFLAVLGGTALIESTDVGSASVLRVYRFEAKSNVVHVWTTIGEAAPVVGTGTFTAAQLTFTDPVTGSGTVVMGKSLDSIERTMHRCASEMGVTKFRRR